MSLSYSVSDTLKNLVPVLDEYAEWYGRLIRVSFYPDRYGSDDVLVFPESFNGWAKQAENNEAIEAIVIQRLKLIHTELLEIAEEMVRMAVKTSMKPDIQVFDSFVDLYENFILQLRRLERDCVQADNGLDTLTGLRSHKALMMDLERELDRLSRKGSPFCLVLARIDYHDRISQIVSDQDYDNILCAIAEQIKKCIRSFDDGYRVNDHEFILSLKHSDSVGGNAAISRLRRYLEESDIRFMEGEKKHPVTMSFCLTEPVPGDQIKETLDFMREDLNRFDQDGGDTALEFLEMSPLQRYVETAGDGN